LEAQTLEQCLDSRPPLEVVLVLVRRHGVAI
jgi:hypothetical protein